MAEIKIKEINEKEIIFSDGSCITYGHEQDCCEYNYADFAQIDDLARSYTYNTPLKFEKCEGGFRFGDARVMFFVPCYSEQNGYYTTDIDIFYSTPIKPKKRKTHKLVLSFECDII